MAAEDAAVGVFQIRGGKHMFVHDADGTAVLLAHMQRTFLHGDHVLYTAASGSLKHIARQEQYVLGIVAGSKNGRLRLHFPQYPHFIADVCYMMPLVQNDRILVYLAADGGVLPIQVFSGSAGDDVRAVLAAYLGRPTLSPLALQPPTYGPSRYTRTDVVDLTHLFTCTVDPRDSVDLDDAISIDADTRRIFVHIVDIHSYLEKYPDLEDRMRTRGQSLYLANEHTEHLLPVEHASEGASLLRGVPRSAITVQIQFGGETVADIVSYEIYRSTILVKERYTYEDVGRLLDTNNDTFQILKLLTQRMAQQQIYLNMPSLRLTIGADGIPLACVPEHTQDASHSLIANCMILANALVGHHLAKYEDVYLPSRFHRAPPSCGDSSGLVRICDNPLVNAFATLKKWSRAEYSLDEKGHFGLGLREYVHFTSPMRRYADVLVHHILAGANFSRDTLDTLAAHLNVRGAHVRSLHDLYRSIKVNRYLHYVGRYPTVYITDVSRAGILWYCPEYLLNGFTHVSKLYPSGRWSLQDSEGEGHRMLVHAHASEDMRIRIGDRMTIVEFFCDYTTLQYTLTLCYSDPSRP